jgi:hypothetical protein
VVYSFKKASIKEHGKILTDFANAHAIDAACFTYFENIQNLLSFTPDFGKQILKIFPSLQSFLEPLNYTEKTLLKLISEEFQIIDYLNTQFSSIDYELTSYDSHNRMLNLMSSKWERSEPDNQTSEMVSRMEENGIDGFLNTLKMLGISAVDGPIAIKIDAIADEIKNHMGKETMDQIKNLMKIGRVIDESTSGFTENRLKNLQDLTQQFQVIDNFHQEIEKIQTDLRDILEGIVGGLSLKDIPMFLEFLKVYNSMQNKEIVISDNDALISLAPMNATNYLQINGVNAWSDVLLNEVAFWTVEFFRHEKAKRYIRKCSACSTYFIPNRLGKQKFCRKSCRLDRRLKKVPNALQTGVKD